MSVRELLALMAYSKKETLRKIDMNENKTTQVADRLIQRSHTMTDKHIVCILECSEVLHRSGFSVRAAKLRLIAEQMKVNSGTGLTDAEIEGISDSIDWRDVELHYLAQIKFARAVLAAGKGGLK